MISPPKTEGNTAGGASGAEAAGLEQPYLVWGLLAVTSSTTLALSSTGIGNSNKRIRCQRFQAFQSKQGDVSFQGYPLSVSLRESRMRIFLSFASEDRELAEEIQLALVGSGHKVFFDKASLPAGGDYHSRIESAVRDADIFVFLISANSVAKGSYALTELKFARVKWPHPKERIVPVRLDSTPWAAMPPYLRSVTVLEPEGNVAAEVVGAVAALRPASSESPTVNHNRVNHDLESGDREVKDGASQRAQIWVAVLGLIGVLGAALIANWPSGKPTDPIAQVLLAPKPKSTSSLVMSEEGLAEFKTTAARIRLSA